MAEVSIGAERSGPYLMVKDSWMPKNEEQERDI